MITHNGTNYEILMDDGAADKVLLLSPTEELPDIEIDLSHLENYYYKSGYNREFDWKHFLDWRLNDFIYDTLKHKPETLKYHPA